MRVVKTSGVARLSAARGRPLNAARFAYKNLK